MNKTLGRVVEYGRRRVTLPTAEWEEITPEIEQMIVEEVRAVRAEKRAKREQASRANRS